MSGTESLASLKGTTTFFHGQYDAESVTVTICCALAIYNACELLLLVFTTFRRYAGLYFWSLLIAGFGILPYTIGYLIEYFRLTAQLAGEIISAVGWPMVVTGQSFVLYSRLGIVLGPSHGNILKAVKWMIITNGVVFYVSTEIAMFGAYNAKHNHGFAQAYKYIEKIQMTGFTVQEFILSGLYLWRALDILRTSPANGRRQRIMRELFGINVLIVIMDIALLVVEYQNRHVIEQAIKGVVYSVKLKLEFAILSKLINITRTGSQSYAGTFENVEMDGRGDSLANGHMPVQTDFITAKSESKHDVLHIERASSWISGTTHVEEHTAHQPTLSLTKTADEQRRRRTLEDNMYAGACRDIAG